MNRIFKKFETLINDSNNNKKKEQYTNYIIDIFEKFLNNDVNIKLCIKAIRKRSKLLNIT